MNIVNVLEKQCHAQIPRNWFILKPLKVMCYPNTTCRGIKTNKTLIFTPKNLQKKLWNYFKGDFNKKLANLLITTVKTLFCQVFGKKLQPSGLLTCVGTLRNQSHIMRTSKNLSGTSKRANNHMGDFQMKAVLTHFLQGSGRD